MDIIEYLNNKGVKTYTSGKNVSQGFVNIQCPFCDDKTNHLGIKISNPRFMNCWKCGRKNPLDLIQYFEEEKINRAEAKKILENFDYDISQSRSIFFKNQDAQIVKKVLLPKECLSLEDFPSIHLKYLKQRGFKNPKKIIQKYNLKAVYMEGLYKYRIIIPIYQYGKLVSFISRDITGKQKIKYKNSQYCTIERSKLFFNLDSVKEGENAIIVEGPFDVMKIGDGSFCMLGVSWNNQRINEIRKKKINELYIFFDSDITGRTKAREIGSVLAPCVNKIHFLKMNYGKVSDIKRIYKDPGELPESEVKILRYSLGFKD